MIRSSFLRVSMLVCLAAAWPQAGAAAVHTVTDFGDSGAPGQLRTLITLAAPGDTILIPPGTIVLGGPANESANAGGDLDVNKLLTIVGSGADLTVIDANSFDRGIQIFGAGHLVLSGITLKNGIVHPDTGGGGGGLNNSGVLHLVLSIVEGSSSGGGGGLFNSGTATIESSTFRGNSASGITGAGGAIMNFGTMTIGTSTFTDNATLGPSASANGGAISNVGDMAITNTTISGNRAYGHGGGIFQAFTADSLTLRHVTITANEARLLGGGLSVHGPAPEPVNTILARNEAGVDSPDCSGTISSQGHNLIGDPSGCTIAGLAAGNIVGVNPHLFPLADNGGPTLTHALKNASAAIDAGSNSACTSADQRGIARPRDGNRDGIPACDIGAIEK